MDYSIIIYAIFGVLPSLTWLSYYLRKDVHPEPRGMILRIFLWGALITIPVFFVQIGLTYLLNNTNINPPILATLIYWFLVIALSEEFFKYLVVRIKVVNSPNLDEPLDLMLYMVVAALGFAAIENVLYLFAPVGQMPLNQIVDRTIVIDIIRFVGATFLHTLCSAVVGYSLAISICNVKTRYFSITAGIIMAVVLHGLYDFSIMRLSGSIKFIIPLIILITLSFFISSRFKQLRNMKGICKLN